MRFDPVPKPLCLLPAFLLLACRDGLKNSAPDSVNAIRLKHAHTIFGWQEGLEWCHDTCFADGTCLHYWVDAEWDVNLTWGDGSFSRTLTDGHVNVPSSSQIMADWPEYIAMKYGCGSPCWTLSLLPKNAADSIRSYQYPLKCHPAKEILFYRPFLNENRFVLENINTQQQLIIVPDSFPEFGLFLDGLDTFFFEKEAFVMTWKTELDFSDDAATKTKRFSLDALYPRWEKSRDYRLSGIPRIRNDQGYFESQITVRIKSENSEESKTQFTALYTSDCQPIHIDVLKWPGLRNVREVLRIEFEISTCGSKIYTHYILVGNDGMMHQLPVIYYTYNDNPDPYQAYVFPNEKYGEKGKILQMEFTPVYGGPQVDEVKMIREIEWTGR